MYEFGRSLARIPDDPRGGRPGDPYVPPEPPPVDRGDPFNGEANAALLSFKTEWQKILAAHITGIGERLRRMRNLLAFVIKRGEIYFRPGSLLSSAFQVLLSQMRSRIAAQVITDKQARGEIVEDKPPEPPPPPPPPPPEPPPFEPEIYPEQPVLPPIAITRPNIPLLEAQARSKGAMTFYDFKKSGLYMRSLVAPCAIPPCPFISAEEQYQAYVRDYVAPPPPVFPVPPDEPPPYWVPPEPGEPPVVALPPPNGVMIPVDVPTDVVPTDVVTAGFDFGALLRPPLIFVLGGVAVLMLLKK